MGNPPFIDIHTHPDFKTFLSANREAKRTNCWRKFNIPLLLKIIDRIRLGSILESQSTLRQLNRHRGSVALVGLLAFEKAIITADIYQSRGIHINLLAIAKILKAIYYRKCLDPDLLQRISLPGSYYFNLFKEAQEHLIKSKTKRSGYNLLTNISNYNPGKLNIILTLEGGHNLFNKTSGNNVENDVLTNLGELKSDSRRYLFMSMAHFEQNLLCTHAYNMKIIDDARFMPGGRGITALGIRVINEALSQHKRILIDIKHMSLISRKQYYQILEDDFGSENIPIIMSHGGVTGISYENIRVAHCETDMNNRWIKVQYDRPDGHIGGTKFNPCSINLYDEEIKKIIDSKGLIGLNLDERILGIKQKREKGLMEYFSKAEFSCEDFEEYRGLTEQEEVLSEFEQRMIELEESIDSELENYLVEIYQDTGRHRNRDYIRRFNGIRNSLIELQRMRWEEERPILKFEKDIKHLCNNILHIVKVGGENAWKHICIGSDFDGLINPVDVCRNATQYKKLSKALKLWLPLTTGITAPRYFINDINQQVDDIMYGNAYRFLCNNFV